MAADDERVGVVVPGRAVRWGWGVLLLVGCAAGLRWSRTQVAVPDESLFRRAGAALLRGRLSEVYADPVVQAGPFELLWVRLLGLADAASPGLSMTVAGAAGVPLSLLGAGFAVRRYRSATGLAAAPVAELAVAALVLAWGVGEVAVFSGHPAQVVAPSCWLWAGVLARSGRGLAAGAVLGLSAGWEVWGVLGAGVLVLAPSARALARGAGSLAGVLAVLYLPFVASGGFAMPGYRWAVAPESVYAAVVPGVVAEAFPWQARLVQAATAGAASVAVALWLRRSESAESAVWLVPLVAVAVRLVLDPVQYDYYWTPVLVLALAGAASTAPGAPPWWAAAALCAWQPWPAAHTWQGTLLATLPLAACALAARARSAGGGLQALRQGAAVRSGSSAPPASARILAITSSRVGAHRRRICDE